MTFKHLKGCNKWPLLPAALKPGHFLAWPQDPRPGAACSLGMWLQPLDFLAAFPFVDFTVSQLRSIQEKHTDTQDTDRMGYRLPRQDAALTAPPENQHQWPNPLFVRQTQEVIHAGAHTELPGCMNTHTFTGPTAWPLCLPGNPTQIPGPLTGHRAPLIPGCSSKHAVLVQHGLPILPMPHPRPRTSFLQVSPDGSVQVCDPSTPVGRSWSCHHSASAPITQLPPSAATELLTCFTHTGSSWELVFGTHNIPTPVSSSWDPRLSSSWHQARVTNTPILAPVADTQPFKPSHIQDTERLLWKLKKNKKI